MLEQHMIQSRGFKNVLADGKPVGFELRIRTNYYRGIWVTLLEGAEVTVDGVKFGREAVRWTIGNRSYTVAELEQATDVRWPFEEAAVLTVPKPGGLLPGRHQVEVSVFFRASYMPENMQPWAERANKDMTLIQ